MVRGLRKIIGKSPIGGYTSYLRNKYESGVVNMREIDISNMEEARVSKLNPWYLLEKLKSYFFKN